MSTCSFLNGLFNARWFISTLEKRNRNQGRKQSDIAYFTRMENSISIKKERRQIFCRRFNALVLQLLLSTTCTVTFLTPACKYGLHWLIVVNKPVDSTTYSAPGREERKKKSITHHSRLKQAYLIDPMEFFMVLF
jgi:hypothetical protein